MDHPLMKYFKYDHLLEHLQDVSKPFFYLADKMDRDVLDSSEKSAGMRKLLEAKDCFVRANL